MATVDQEEARLVARANAGEPGALEALYRAHRGWALALATRLTGSPDDGLDVLQETFAWFFGRFPGFELTSTVRAFLYPVVRHQSLSLLRRRRRVVELSSVREPEALPDTAFPGELARMTRPLPDGQREVLLLRFGLDMTLAEIGDALSVPVGTVKSRLHHALAALREAEAADEAG